MRRFDEWVKVTLSSEQKKEIRDYLHTQTEFVEEDILKICRKLKELERRIDESKYNR